MKRDPNQPLRCYVVPHWSHRYTAGRTSPRSVLAFSVYAVYPGYRSIKELATFDHINAKLSERKANRLVRIYNRRAVRR